MTHPAAALLRVLDLLPEVTEIELMRISVPPSVENRPGATAALAAYAEKARVSRFEGDSFTEAFLAVAEDHDDLRAALEVVGFHQPLAQALERIPLGRQDVIGEVLSGLVEQTPQEQMLIVSSKVRADYGTAHIPMLDMKLAARRDNDRVAEAVAARLGGGILVDSGSSYHLYGTRLLTPVQMTEWLLRAQLLTRCVDTRWVTHQLLEGRAALRLSRGGASDAVPTVLSHV